MANATVSLAKFVQAAGQLRSAWYEARAHFSASSGAYVDSFDTSHKIESAEEMLNDAVANAEAILKACAKFYTSKSPSQPPLLRPSVRPNAPVSSELGGDSKMQGSERRQPPWNAMNRPAEPVKDLPTTKTHWSEVQTPRRVNSEDVPQPWKRKRDDDADSDFIHSQSEWSALRRKQARAHRGRTSRSGLPKSGLPSERVDDNIPPERLSCLSQERLRDLLQASIERWLHNRNRKVNNDAEIQPLDLLRNAPKFRAIYPLIDPPIESLADWISENMHDITVTEGWNGQAMIGRRRVADPNDPEEQTRYQQELREFLNGLPEDHFTDEEEDLREELLFYLHEWKGDSAPLVVDCYNTRFEIGVEITLCMWALLPRRIKLKDWIDNRMGGDIDVFQNDAGQIAFQLVKSWQFDP